MNTVRKKGRFMTIEKLTTARQGLMTRRVAMLGEGMPHRGLPQAQPYQAARLDVTERKGSMSMRERRSASRIDTRQVARVEGVEHRRGKERGYARRSSKLERYRSM